MSSATTPMKPRILILATIALASCSSLTPSQQSAAQGLATIAIQAAAAKYGVSPTETQAITTASNSLFGMAAQAQASQPVAQGASNVAIGNAVAAQVPAGTPDQTAALLQAAAVAAQGFAKK